MIIPINTEKDHSLALSIAETDEGYSVVPCSILNAYGLSPLPSYMIKRDKFTTELGTTVAPIVSYDYPEKRVEGEDLLKCLNMVMASLGADNKDILPINVPDTNSLVLLMCSTDRNTQFSVAYAFDAELGEKVPNTRAVEHSKEYDHYYSFIHGITVMDTNFYRGLDKVLFRIGKRSW